MISSSWALTIWGGVCRTSRSWYISTVMWCPKVWKMEPNQFCNEDKQINVILFHPLLCTWKSFFTDFYYISCTCYFICEFFCYIFLMLQIWQKQEQKERGKEKGNMDGYWNIIWKHNAAVDAVISVLRSVAVFIFVVNSRYWHCLAFHLEREGCEMMYLSQSSER